MLRFLWQEVDAVGVRAFFDSWYAWAIRSRLTPIKKVARMLKNRLDRILIWFSGPISNGPADGFNSRIQSIKSAARGFRIFEHYRIRILFFCGKLSLKQSENSQPESQKNPEMSESAECPTRGAHGRCSVLPACQNGVGQGRALFS
jgi:hypothetical protein